MSLTNEDFALYWLDENVHHSDDNQRVWQELRQLVRCSQAFDDYSECEHAVRSFAQDKRLVLIVSGRLGERLVPGIHHLPHVAVIYVYCMDRQRNEQWSREFLKVRDIITRRETLVNRIRADVSACRPLAQESMSFHIFAPQGERRPAKRELRKQFVHSLILMKLLRRLNIANNHEGQLLERCKQENELDSDDIRMFRDFRREYSPDRATWWYTRDFPFSDLLHWALDGDDMLQLLLFRFFIVDMDRELRRCQRTSSDPVYYGQVMSRSEYNYLCGSIGGLLLVKTFLRANSNRHVVEQMLDDKEAERQQRARDTDESQYSVMFVIDVSLQAAATKPFAKIDQLGGFIERGAVLFMAASVFQIRDVTIAGIQATVHLELCDENSSDVQYIYRRVEVTNALANTPITLAELGGMLAQMEKYHTATHIYELARHELVGHSLELVDLHCALGVVSKRRQEHLKCAGHYKAAIECQKHINSNAAIALGRMYCCAADAYLNAGQLPKAIQKCERAIENYRRGDATNDPNLAEVYSLRGLAYERQDNGRRAFDSYQRAISIDSQNPTHDRASAVNNHISIGNTSHRQGRTFDAIQHFVKAVEIQTRLSSTPNRTLAETLHKVADGYKAMNHRRQALDFYERTVAVLEQLPLFDQRGIEEVRENIRKLQEGDPH